MAWESALDRLVLQQIHRAEKGEARTPDARDQVLALWQLEGRATMRLQDGSAGHSLRSASIPTTCRSSVRREIAGP